jgi:hypothetical protein
MIKQLIVYATFLLISISAIAESKYTTEEYSFARIFQKAKTDPKWTAAKTLSDRMWLIRAYGLKEPKVSDPVSDWYAVTCYGGSIDLVHFMGLAIETCSGKHKLEEALYKQWISEGGWGNLRGYNHRTPPAATPEDLPSNAFGALFGKEIKPYNNDLTFDLEQAFIKFITPLKPVPDKIAKKFSHNQIVLGLTDYSSKQQQEKSHCWFTAEPLFTAKMINKVSLKVLKYPICDEATSAKDAMERAGFKVEVYKKRTIIIRRSKK